MQITTGVIQSAQKVVVYGPEGIGKTTFASKFPKPLFIDTEGSSKMLDVARTPAPTSWSMLLGLVEEIKKNNMGYQTLVLDTADWAEILCSDYVCATKGGKNAQMQGIEDFGYGKGYTYLAEEFGKLLNLLTSVANNGMHIVVTAHAIMRKFEQPDEIGAYDRWELKLQKKTAPLLKEWADAVLFANYKIYSVNVDNQGASKGKNKAQGGKRVMYTTHHPCWDAKNRWGLSDELDFDFKSIEKHLPSPAAKPPVAAPSVQEASPATVEKPAPKPEPVQEQKKQEALPPVAPVDAVPDTLFHGGALGQLQDLMAQDNITFDQVRQAVAAKGYYPYETLETAYEEGFIKAVLIGAWPQVLKLIKENGGAK